MPKTLPKMTSFEPPSEIIAQSFIPFSGLRKMKKEKEKERLPMVFRGDDETDEARTHRPQR